MVGEEPQLLGIPSFVNYCLGLLQARGTSHIHPLVCLCSSIHISLNFDYLPVDSYIPVHVISWTAARPGTHGAGLAFSSVLSGQSDFTETIIFIIKFCFKNIHSSYWECILRVTCKLHVLKILFGMTVFQN